MTKKLCLGIWNIWRHRVLKTWKMTTFPHFSPFSRILCNKWHDWRPDLMYRQKCIFWYWSWDNGRIEKHKNICLVITTLGGFHFKNHQNRPKSAIFSDLDGKKRKTTHMSRYNTYASWEGAIRTKHSGSLIKIVRAVFEKKWKNLEKWPKTGKNGHF